MYPGTDAAWLCGDAAVVPRDETCKYISAGGGAVPPVGRGAVPCGYPRGYRGGCQRLEPEPMVLRRECWTGSTLEMIRKIVDLAYRR